MLSTYWQAVRRSGLRVPPDRPLDELTAELTGMLGDPDPRVREDLALATLGTWIHEGVYDELLAGLGGGMCTGLGVGLGRTGDDSALRRSSSALVLAECIDRDSSHSLVPADVVLGWGDRLTGWYVRERDLRDFVPGRGWVHALAHGADALGALARSPHLGPHELTVVLDVIADRLLLPTDGFWHAGETDRMAQTVLHVLRRDLLDVRLLEPWVARLAASAAPTLGGDEHPYRSSDHVQAFLRSLHLQVALATPQPKVRADLLLVLISALTRTNPGSFTSPPRH